jgi:thiamine biosynthesis lipoprotein
MKPRRRLLVATPLFLSAMLATRQWSRPRPGGDGTLVPPGEALVRVAGTAFGTTVSLGALCPAGDRAGRATRAALRCAMQEVQLIDGLFSLFRPDSQLSALNRDGRLDAAHPHLLRNLEFAVQLGGLTRGAFDLTVQPLWELFALARREGRLPARPAIAAARGLVDYRALRIEGERVRLERPAVRVTLNSLAQGYAVDVVLDILRRNGIEAALIDTGEIGNLGTRAVDRPWTVGIQHPRDRGALIALVGMDGRVLSTSGDYATTFSADFRYHHIFDPASGVSPTGWSSTIVLAGSGMVADGISTALMVMGRAAGAELVRAFPGSDALWIDKQAVMTSTAGVPIVEEIDLG